MRTLACVHFLVYCVLITLVAHAQQADTDKIIVIGSASIQVPADRAIIRIHLSFTDEVDGKRAFEQHKDAEDRLIQFIRNKSIPDSLVTYSLINISAGLNYSHPGSPIKTYSSNQTVTITLTDLHKLSATQLELVSKGFASFDEEFQSTKAPDAVKQAITQAVKQARSKAELMASATGRRIKKISKISDTEDTEPVIARYFERIAYAAKVGPSLMDIPQTLSVDKQVKVVFELDN